MGASDRHDVTGEAAARCAPGEFPTADVGSWEHLQAAFARAAIVADRAVGLWLARDAKGSIDRSATARAADRPDIDVAAHRALARAAATAYVRRAKADGLPPERMLVLVKAATSIHGLLGFGAQALTSDIVRWSIDAYFDE